VPKRNYDGVKMPITDLLDNVPPNPPGFVPYTPPYTTPIDPGLIPPPTNNGNNQGTPTVPTTPIANDSTIPDNVFGWFMLMMGV